MRGTKAEALDATRREKRASPIRASIIPATANPAARSNEGTISRWLEEARAVFERAKARRSWSAPRWADGSRCFLRVPREATFKERDIAGMVLIAPAPDFTEALMWPRFPTRRSASNGKRLLACGRRITATGPIRSPAR